MQYPISSKSRGTCYSPTQVLTIRGCQLGSYWTHAELAEILMVCLDTKEQRTHLASQNPAWTLEKAVKYLLMICPSRTQWNVLILSLPLRPRLSHVPPNFPHLSGQPTCGYASPCMQYPPATQSASIMHLNWCKFF